MAVEVADPRRSSAYEPSHVIQLLVSLQKDVSHLAAKSDRLIADVAKLDSEVDALRTSFSRAQGFGACAVLLVPICAVIVWWLIGDKLNDLKGQVLQSRPQPGITQPGTPLALPPRG